MTAAKSLAPREVAHVIEIRRNRPMVSSLKIAELFGRPHNAVLKAIRKELMPEISLGKIDQSDYVDSRGKQQPAYWLDERQALVLMPFLGGTKSRDGQRQLVDAYLYYRDNFANPPRRDLLTAKRAANRPMLDALVEAREEAGKETKERHFMTEAKLCNGVLTGKYAKLDERTLSNTDLELLEQIRRRNESYLIVGLDYATRKAKLSEFALRQRTKRLPRQTACLAREQAVRSKGFAGLSA